MTLHTAPATEVTYAGLGGALFTVPAQKGITYAEAALIDLSDALELEALDPADPEIDAYLESAAHNERVAQQFLALADGRCDLGHPECEDQYHSEAYHSADCRCGRTEATCKEEYGY